MKLIWVRYKEYVVAILFGVLFFAVIQYVLIPLFHRIQAQRNSIQELSIDHKMRTESVANVGVLRNQSAVALDKADDLRMIVPKSDIVHLIETIERLADETHNVIAIESQNIDVPKKPVVKKPNASKNVVTKKEETKEKTLQESIPYENYLLLTIKVTGDYNDILHFMKKVETMPYALDVLSFSIAPEEKKPESGIRASGDIFSLAKPEDAANKDQSAAPENAGKLQAVFNTAVYVVGD